MDEVQKSQLPPNVFEVNLSGFGSNMDVVVYEIVSNLLTSVLQQRAVNQTCLRCHCGIPALL